MKRFLMILNFLIWTQAFGSEGSRYHPYYLGIHTPSLALQKVKSERDLKNKRQANENRLREFLEGASYGRWPLKKISELPEGFQNAAESFKNERNEEDSLAADAARGLFYRSFPIYKYISYKEATQGYNEVYRLKDFNNESDFDELTVPDVRFLIGNGYYPFPQAMPLLISDYTKKDPEDSGEPFY